MGQYFQLWSRVEALLRHARAQLPNYAGLEQDLKVFEEFLDHNELGLAWEQLAEVAEVAGAGPDCWRNLSEAAELMGI